MRFVIREAAFTSRSAWLFRTGLVVKQYLVRPGAYVVHAGVLELRQADPLSKLAKRHGIARIDCRDDVAFKSTLEDVSACTRADAIQSHIAVLERLRAALPMVIVGT